MDTRLWEADLGNGFYRNPILPGDYSDPDVIRVGEDYYMVASSFCNAPGLPLLHSKDLVNWKIVNYILPELPLDKYAAPLHGHGVFAPSIRFHDEYFYAFIPIYDDGIYMSRAKDPFGKWEVPVLLLKSKYRIDPCPFWDDDGNAYLVMAGVTADGGSRLHMMRMSPDAKSVSGEETVIFDGRDNGQYTIEGPKVYKRNGWYYIFAPAGGVKVGWQTVLRSKSIWGPYEFRIVMRQGSTEVNGPHQGGWVTTQTGEDWFLHFQDRVAAGRVVHLEPLVWKEDGWPVIGRPVPGQDWGEPVPKWKKPDVGKKWPPCEPAATDYFGDCDGCSDNRTKDSGGRKLGLQWQWNANCCEDWYCFEDQTPGLFLKAVPCDHDVKLCNVSNLLLQKWPLNDFTCITKMHVGGLKEGEIAGIVSQTTFYAGLAAMRKQGQLRLCLITGCRKEQDEETRIFFPEILPDTLYFRYRVQPAGYRKYAKIEKAPFEKLTFSYSTDGKDWQEMHTMDSSPGYWVGTKNGVFALGYGTDGAETGTARVEYVVYS